MKKNPKSKQKRGRKRKGALLKQLASITGVPGKTIRKEFQEILERKQINIHDITLEQLRNVVACYLRQIMGGMLDRASNHDQSH